MEVRAFICRSDPQQGILATVRKGDREYQLALSELEFVDPDPVSAEWLAVYHYWLGQVRW